MTRVYLHTFGCKANQYDTEVVRQALEDRGARIVDSPSAADHAVVNTCAVTHVSEAKMRGLVRRLARENRTIRTVVMGCAAALDRGALARLGNVVRVVQGADPVSVLDALGFRADGVAQGLRSFARGSRAWLKIQDGCDEHCTFCATTLARGANRSRAWDAIRREAELLSASHAEIVLTGVHIGGYGRDLASGEDLATLVERLVRTVPAVRFRLSSVEATEVDHRLVALMEGVPDRLAPHLHAPLQSGSDRVLKRMGRHWYTAATYRTRIERIAARVPTLGLGADVMVGFPGETEADHRATVSLVRDLPFTYLHVFPYSERSGTAAPRLGPAADAAVTRQRSRELRELATEKGVAYRATRDGGRADVVRLRRGSGRLEGVTEDYLMVFSDTRMPLPARFAASLALEDDGTLSARALSRA
ncbi:MAG: MiaB/RimO family radical SAM methylthiotransferase [Gemmatimonadales bacterium]